MRDRFASWCIFVCIFALIAETGAQQPTMPTQFGVDGKPTAGEAASKAEAMFEVKIKAEWEAIKTKDKKAYADLLADEYQGVEVDGKGERNKLQSVNELEVQNVTDYTLWGFKLIPAGPDAALAIYEVTMQFPPKSQVRFSRIYISELWKKRGGDWKIVHYQETHVK
ncbi:MAG: nuclear transport factor 2 family protein [Candidatus Sulfotelmatobacter sp.]